MANNITTKVSPFQTIRDKLKITNSKFFNKLQRLGKAMIFPIVVLPVAAIFLRLGSLMTDTSLPGIQENNAIWWIGTIFTNIGSPMFSYLPYIFAVGLAFGLANENRGEAALVGLVSIFVLTSLVGENCFPKIFYQNVRVYSSTDPNDPLYPLNGYSELLYSVKNGAAYYCLDLGVFGGIIAGCFSALFYNKWKDIKLPRVLAFFEGRNFVPIIAILLMVPIAIVISCIWPWIQLGLTSMGVWLIGTGGAGVFVYMLVKTLLVLFGLHNIIGNFVNFQLPITGVAAFNLTYNGVQYIAGATYTVNGDLNAFMAGIKGSGLFQVGSFPEIMGGYWGLTLAIILACPKAKRKDITPFMLSTCAVCSLTGVGEPLVLPVWYAAPFIYFIHAILNALSGTLAASLGMRIGFGFSAGWIDYAVSIHTSWKFASMQTTTLAQVMANPLWMIPVAGVTGIVFFFVMYFIITKANIKTMGRGNEEVSSVKKKVNVSQKAADIYKTLGGKKNITNISNCVTRIRLELKDNTKVNQTKLKSISGVYGIKIIGKNALQIIIGQGVGSLTEQVKQMWEQDAA